MPWRGPPQESAMSAARSAFLLACLSLPGISTGVGAAPAPFPRPNPADEKSWSQPVDGLRFRLVAPKTRLRVGEPIRLVLEIQNVGKGPAILEDPELLPMICPPGEHPFGNSFFP